MILIFDFETTGLTLHPMAAIELQPRAIEFGGALLNEKTCQIEEEIELLINPQQQISDEITEITGITNSMLSGAPSFVDLLPTFRRVFGAADCCIAHNLPFDKAILKCELVRAAAIDFPWPQSELCTVSLYYDEYGRMPKLTELYERIIGRPLRQKHRALGDVMALTEIVTHEKLWTLV